MITYLINATIIWLLCLLCFDLLLRRETYHGLNRAYLLISLVMGLVIPTFRLPSEQPTVNRIIWQQPMQQLTTAKQKIVANLPASAPTPHHFNWTLAIKYGYLAGVLVSLLLLVKEIAVLVLYYRKNQRQQEGHWTVIETGKQHGPFSFRHLLFVRERALYDATEWKIILQHEQEHARRRHFIDMALLQLVQVVFWFHPLVYLFKKRLLLVHEYQADVVGSSRPKVYGKFLLEQSMLQGAPLIAHSFSQSPIHNRIFMLTRSSSPRAHLLKLGIVLPLIGFSFLCCTKSKPTSEYTMSAGKDAKHKLVTFRGNTIELEVIDSQNICATDSLTKKEACIGMIVEPNPTKLNDANIYDMSEVTQKAVFKGPDERPLDYLFNSLKEDLKELKDGHYSIMVSSVIVDEHGKVAYYNHVGIESQINEDNIDNEAKSLYEIVSKLKEEQKRQKDQMPTIGVELRNRIEQKLKLALNELEFTPAYVNGKAVPVSLSPFDLGFTSNIVVNDHNASLKAAKTVTIIQ